MSLLAVKDLSIHFGGVKAVQNVSFNIDAGIVYSVIGPNGAGKTTLFNLITGVYKPTTGEIKLDGEAIHGKSPNELAVRGVARTFQNLQICMNMSAIENVMVGAHLRLDRNLIKAALRLPSITRRDAELRAEAAEHKAQRMALIEEVKAWAQEHAASGDWKAINRALHQFGDRWREGGHVGEKIFAELQPLWKQTIAAAAAPLENAQKESLARRHAMIDEAVALGAAPTLRIDAVKALQQRWQAEAQTVPLDRKHEQKLWDAFRKPIDEAFNRKSADREKAVTELSARDRVVLEASKALEAANASGDVQQIRSAMQALEAALHGQAQAQAAMRQLFSQLSFTVCIPTTQTASTGK